MDWPSNPDVGLVDGKFTDGNPLTDTPPSLDLAAHDNAITDELLAVITDLGGLVPDEIDVTQVRQAIQIYVMARIQEIDLSGYLQRAVSDTLEAGFMTTTVELVPLGGVIAPDAALGNMFTATVEEGLTLAPLANVTGGGMAVIYATQDATGGWGLTLDSSYQIISGEWSTDANAVNALWLTHKGDGVVDVVFAQRGGGV